MLASKIHTWGVTGPVMFEPALPPGEASCCKTLLILDPVCALVLRKRSKKGASVSLRCVKPICTSNHSQLEACSWQLWQGWKFPETEQNLGIFWWTVNISRLVLTQAQE